MELKKRTLYYKTAIIITKEVVIDESELGDSLDEYGISDKLNMAREEATKMWIPDEIANGWEFEEWSGIDAVWEEKEQNWYTESDSTINLKL